MAGGPIYLDFQATTPLEPRALEAMLPWLAGCAGNPHASENAAGRAAYDAVEHARTQVAALIGGEPEGIIFTANATEATNIVLRSFARPGEHIAASAIEHACVYATLCALEAAGARVTTVPVDGDGLVNLDALADAIDDGATLVSVMAVNNEVGTIQPTEAITGLCRVASCRFHTDAAQALGRVPLNFTFDGIDFASLSAHKIYGPQGIGAIYAKPELLSALVPIATGGDQERGLRPGTLSVALCVGFGEACAIAAERIEDDCRHAAGLSERFMARLTAEIADVQVNGSLQSRVPHNLNIAFHDIDADELLALVSQLALSTGSACSSGAIAPSRVLMAMGLADDLIAGSIRIGFGRTTTHADVDCAASALADAVSGLRTNGRAKSARA